MYLAHLHARYIQQHATTVGLYWRQNVVRCRLKYRYNGIMSHTNDKSTHQTKTVSQITNDTPVDHKYFSIFNYIPCKFQIGLSSFMHMLRLILKQGNRWKQPQMPIVYKRQIL